jgi:hypothetical protein
VKKTHLFLPAIFCLLCACSPLQPEGKTPSTPSAQKRTVTNALQSSIKDLDNVRRVEILHIPEDIPVSRPLTPKLLERAYFHKMIVMKRLPLTPPKLEKAIRTTTAAYEKGDENDIRWGVIFYGAKEERIASVYFNSDGKAGYINATPVSFSNGFFSRGLFGWAKAQIPGDLKSWAEPPSALDDTPILESKNPATEPKSPTLEKKSLSLEKKAPLPKKKAPTSEQKAPPSERKSPLLG